MGMQTSETKTCCKLISLTFYELSSVTLRVSMSHIHAHTYKYIPLRARGVSHISHRSRRPLLENVQSGQLHFWQWWGVCIPVESLRGAPRGIAGLLFPPQRDNGVVVCFKCFTWGQKSSSWLAKSGLWPQGLWLVPCWSCEGGWGELVMEASSVLFLFLSETGEKKLRMSCCLSRSNWSEEGLKK